MATEKDLVLFRAALRAGDVIFEYVDKDPEIWLQDWRTENVNPFFHQTENGLFLNMYYGQPSSLWTPWGEYNICGSGSGSWDKHMDILLSRLGATEAIPEKVTQMGHFGPTYALHKVDDVQLPEPKLRERGNFLEYEVAKAVWADMKAQVTK